MPYSLRIGCFITSPSFRNLEEVNDWKCLSNLMQNLLKRLSKNSSLVPAWLTLSYYGTLSYWQPVLSCMAWGLLLWKFLRMLSFAPKCHDTYTPATYCMTETSSASPVQLVLPQCSFVVSYTNFTPQAIHIILVIRLSLSAIVDPMSSDLL